MSTGSGSTSPRCWGGGRGRGAEGGVLGGRSPGPPAWYGADGRPPYHSINFVTCHDGFTLHDIVSYNGKHNEANLEGNRDGTDQNNSWNCGPQGDTGDPGLRPRRG